MTAPDLDPYHDSALDLRTESGGHVAMRRFGYTGHSQIRFGTGPFQNAVVILTPDEADKVADALKAAAQAQREGRPGYELPIRP